MFYIPYYTLSLCDEIKAIDSSRKKAPFKGEEKDFCNNSNLFSLEEDNRSIFIKKLMEARAKLMLKNKFCDVAKKYNYHALMTLNQPSNLDELLKINIKKVLRGVKRTLIAKNEKRVFGKLTEEKQKEILLEKYNLAKTSYMAGNYNIAKNHYIKLMEFLKEIEKNNYSSNKITIQKIIKKKDIYIPKEKGYFASIMEFFYKPNLEIK